MIKLKPLVKEASVKKYNNIKDLKKLVADMVMNAGLNTAHDYEGIEDDSDIMLYLNAINELLARKF